MHRTRAERGSWFVLRALGRQQTPTARVVAVSAPVYVDVGGGSCDPARVPALAAAMQRELEAMLRPMPDDELESEPWETLGPRARAFAEQLPLLRRRVEQAQAFYADLAERAAQQRCGIEAS